MFNRKQFEAFLRSPPVRGALMKMQMPNKFAEFQPLPPLVGISKEVSATPFLRRRVEVDSVALIRSFLHFSRVKIPQEQFDELYAKHPKLAAQFEKYAIRHNLKCPVRTLEMNIAKVVDHFSMKAKYLRELCRLSKGTKPADFEVLRMLMMQRLGELKSDRRWWYFLRFLRSTLGTVHDRVEVYKENTANWMVDILTAFDRVSDVIIHEFCSLLAYLFPVDFITRTGEERPEFGFVLFRTIQEGDYFTEVPSLILEIIRHPKQCSRQDVVRLLDDRRGTVLSDFILAAEVFRFLKESPEFLSKPEGYLAAILDASSPLFAIGANVAPDIFARAPSALQSCQPAIEMLPITGWSLSSAMEVSSAFYHAVAKAFEASESAHRFEVQELRQLADLFLLNPSPDTGLHMATALIEASELVDSVAGVLLGSLVGIGHGFVFVLQVANQYFKGAVETEQERVVSLIGEAENITPKSRKLALIHMTQRKLDLAFLFALAETDDQAVLEAIEKGFVAGLDTREQHRLVETPYR
jgi:hypothetical protein